MTFNLKSILIICAALFGLSTAQTAFATENSAHSQVQFYKDFLLKVHDEEKFESCLIFGVIQRSEILATLLQIVIEDLQKPILLQNSNSTYKIANVFNNDVLVIAQIEDTETDLQALADSLDHMRQKRIIFICATLETAAMTKEFLLNLFHDCEAKKMLNVLAIFGDFPTTQSFHSYSIFPAFQLEQKTFNENSVRIFPHRMRNLLGYSLRTLPDLIFPNTFAFEQDGHVQVGGFMQKLLAIFAESINATLLFPLPVRVNEFRVPQELLSLLRNDSLDIPTTHIYLEGETQFEEASYPYDIGELCVMAPILWYHSFSSFIEVYFSATYIATSVLVYCAMMGLFYLSQRLQKIRVSGSTLRKRKRQTTVDVKPAANLRPLVTFRILVFLTMLWSSCVLTSFLANLNSFLTKPARMPSLRSWNDFENIGQKLMTSTDAYKYILSLCDESCKNMEKSLVFSESFLDVRNHVQNLNTKYAYFIRSLLWQYTALKMKRLNWPIFYYTELCLRRPIFDCFPLHSNSVFKDALNLFLLRFLDHGLRSYWLDATYMELIRLKQFDGRTISQQLERPLDMDYMSFVWPILGCAWLLAAVTFACELVIGHWSAVIRKRNN
ncbi:uncharacterized protein LOC128855541 [Anastrepha ludens]|uniref:uncharacterized protein LOC128855541 n=1 Tax=Anastrepha ludens TaxID=28586 RepID=UPI0023AEC12D|nr:uncharacterized protein LOC128855541 [Anastrepha ludens]